jgi:hypothetical protein
VGRPGWVRRFRKQDIGDTGSPGCEGAIYSDTITSASGQARVVLAACPMEAGPPPRATSRRFGPGGSSFTNRKPCFTVCYVSQGGGERTVAARRHAAGHIVIVVKGRKGAAREPMPQFYPVRFRRAAQRHRGGPRPGRVRLLGCSNPAPQEYARTSGFRLAFSPVLGIVL